MFNHLQKRSSSHTTELSTDQKYKSNTSLTAIAATHHSNNATPTRPDAVLRVPGPSPQPPAYGAANEEAWETESYEREGSADNDDDEELLRLQERAAEAEPEPAEVATPLNTSSTSTSTSTTSKTAAAPAADITEVAIFTAGGVVFTVTSINGVEAVDGKTLTAGAPGQLIGNERISEGVTGAVIVGGQTLSFAPYSSSSSVPPRGVSSTTAASGSSSAAATAGGGGGGQAAGSSTSPGAAAMQTAGVGVVALVGAGVGAMVL